MDIAADAGIDAIAPQAPPRPAADANAHAPDGASFQDHLNSASGRTTDQTNESRRQSRQNASTPGQSTSGAAKSETTDAAAADKDKAPDEQSAQLETATASPQHPPVLVQLIAATPHLTAQQQETKTDTQAPNAAQQATTTAANIDPTALPAAAPAQTQPATPRAQAKVQHAKATTGKSASAPKQDISAVTDAPATLAEAPTDQLSAAPTAAVPATVATAAQSQTSQANNASIAGVQAAATRETQRRALTPLQPTTSSLKDSPATAKQAQPEKSAPEAKQSTPKAAAAIEQLKQAAQDLAASAKASAPAPAPSSPNTAPLAHAAAATSAQSASADAAPARAAPLAAAQVGSEIIRRFNGHDTTFQLRLDPPELGRVDVRLDVSRDHRVTAVISADTPQALSDLSRGARDLQQALQSAGLELADDGLSFDLSSNGQSNSFAQAGQQTQHAGSAAGAVDASIAPEAVAARPLRVDSWRGSRIDLMA